MWPPFTSQAAPPPVTADRNGDEAGGTGGGGGGGASGAGELLTAATLLLRLGVARRGAAPGTVQLAAPGCAVLCLASLLLWLVQAFATYFLCSYVLLTTYYLLLALYYLCHSRVSL